MGYSHLELSIGEEKDNEVCLYIVCISISCDDVFLGTLSHLKQSIGERRDNVVCLYIACVLLGESIPCDDVFLYTL